MTEVRKTLKLLNEKQAAEVLGLSHRTLQNWRVKGGGPRFVKLSGSVRYRERDLEAWVESRVTASTSGLFVGIHRTKGEKLTPARSAQ